MLIRAQMVRVYMYINYLCVCVCAYHTSPKEERETVRDEEEKRSEPLEKLFKDARAYFSHFPSFISFVFSYFRILFFVFKPPR